MHLRLSEDEFSTLIDMISLAAEISSLNQKPGNEEHLEAFSKLEDKILERASGIGFADIIEIDPDYTALYYHLAEVYLETDQIEKARDTYLKGISILEKSGNAHALKELKNAYQNFLFEYD